MGYVCSGLGKRKAPLLAHRTREKWGTQWIFLFESGSSNLYLLLYLFLFSRHFYAAGFRWAVTVDQSGEILGLEWILAR
jgi:hypothetical protein